MHYTRVFFLLFILCCSGTAKAQSLSGSAEISLLTCGPGNELYSVFGHTAIRVYDPLSKIDIVYNYGTFDFDTPNFYMKFAKGDLQYMLSSSSYEDFVYTYEYYDRDVYEQVLNLTQLQKQAIADELKVTISSDKRFYTYKFIHRNCTTMAADQIQAVIPDTISKDIEDKGKTYREILFSSLHNHFFENLGISLVFGYKTDEVSNLLFLPRQLMEGVGKTSIDGKPLVRDTITVYKSTGINQKPSLFNNFYVFCVLLLPVLLFSGRKWVQNSWLVIMGLLGVFFLVVGGISSHIELLLNYNALLVNPFYLVILVLLIMNRLKWAMMACYVGIACIVLYFFLMINKPHLVMVLPLIVVTLVILIRIILHCRRQIQAGPQKFKKILRSDSR